MLRKEKLSLSKIIGAPVEFIEHGYKPKHPVQLECGHSICEACAVHGGPRVVTCSTCSTKTHLKSVATADLPRSSRAYARAAASQPPPNDQPHSCMQAPNFYSFVGQISRLCDGCYKRLASLACHMCDRFLCDNCWPKVHCEGSWIHHVPLSVNSAKLRAFGRCKSHRTKFVELYCQDCRQYICPDCIVRKHNGIDHDIISVTEKNMEMLDRLTEVQKDVRENLRRMEKTLRDVLILKDTTDDSSSSDFTRDIVDRLIQFNTSPQSSEEALRQKLKRREANRRIDLDNILTQLRGQITMITLLFNDIRIISDCEPLLRKVSVEAYFPILMDMKYAPCLLSQPNSNRDTRYNEEEGLIIDDDDSSDDENACMPAGPPKCSLELVNIRGQNNSDLGRDEEAEGAGSKNIVVSRGQIVSGSPGESAPRMRLGHYSSLNLMRFPAARTHSLIAEGCSYGVHLSHVKDPGEFYVVRTTARKQQQRIERLAPTLVDRCGHAPKKLQKDELYLVECVLDRKWYRGRVVEVLTRRTPNEDSSVLIFNLDYGNTQVVPHSRLRVMPELLQAEPAMALRCRLSECIPANGKWCRQAAKMMIEMMKEGVVTMYVVRVLPDILEVDLTHKNDECAMFEGEVTSLRDSMVFMEYSILVSHPHANQVKRSMTTHYPHFFLPKVNSTFTGIITHVVSSTRMYMQKVSVDTDYLIDLMERINAFYDLNNQKGYLYNPVIGMPCVALCPQDYLWYRARVVDLPGQEKITIQYVDYGNEDTLNYKLVRKLKLEFRALPPQAFLCNLDDMINPRDRNWRLDAKAYMKKLSDEVFQVAVLSVDDGIVDVQLKLDPCCFKPPRIQPCFVLFSKRPSRPFHRIRPSALAGIAFDPKVVPDTSDRGKAAKLMELYDNALQKDDEPEVEEEPLNLLEPEIEAALPLDDFDEMIGRDIGIRVKILKVTSPSDIFVSVQSFLPRMRKMEKELQEFYKVSAIKKNLQWTPGCYCVVNSQQHEKWVRGVVREIKGNDKILVQFLDMIGTEEIPISNMRQLELRFLKFPIGSVKCHLDGLPRMESDWPENVKELLVSELEKYNKVYMTKRGKLQDLPSLPVKLWVKIRIGPNTESCEMYSREKWINLNDLVREQGLKIPKEKNASDSNAEDPEGAKEECGDEDDIYYFDERSILNEEDFKINSYSKYEFDDNTDANGNERRLTEWVQPEPSTVKYFIGEPTHIDIDGCIYLHDIERDGSSLELLQYSLYQFYKDTSPDPTDVWAVNDICVAKYFIDNCWYRGKIVEKKENLYRVYFVDFGHVETCLSSWLRKSMTFIDTPTLAQKYELFGVNPVSENGEWPAEVIDKIYETIIEKKCNITVVEREPGAVPKIYLRVRENDQDLAEYLVTLGAATYGPEMESVGEDPYEAPRNFFEERFQDVEIFPVAPVTQAYNSGYRPLDIPTVSFPFPIKVTTVREYHICANIVDDEAIYPRLRRNIASLQRLTEQMQVLGEQQPVINNAKPGVACLSLYGGTRTWHRAEVEGIDSKSDLVLLNYVDYGYTEYVTRDRIRTILPRWFDIPRMALNFKLYRLKKNPEVRRKAYLDELTQALSHSDLMARIVQKCKDYYEVEIRRKNSNDLAYQKLIDEGLLLPLEDDEIDYFDGFAFEDDDEEEEEAARGKGPNDSDNNEDAEERGGPNDSDNNEETEERGGPNDSDNNEETEEREGPNNSDNNEETEEREGPNDSDNNEETEEREGPNDSDNSEDAEEREGPNDSDNSEDAEEREGPNDSDNNEDAEEREGPEERQGSGEGGEGEGCNGAEECEGSGDCDGSDECEGSEDMGASDDDDNDEEGEEEEIDSDEEEDEDEEDDGESEESEGTDGEEEEEDDGEEVEEEEEILEEDCIEIEVEVD